MTQEHPQLSAVFEKSPLADGAFRAARTLRDSGHLAFFAGGCVRDALMGKIPQDFDIATSAKPGEVEALFSKTVPVGRQFGVILVVLGDTSFEVATFRSDGAYVDGRHPVSVRFSAPEEDAARRDFTVNGLFYDPVPGQVLDFVDGIQDIDKKIIRAIGIPEERFGEDKLRLLRAVRFASSLGFSIDPATWESLTRLAPLIHQVSPERIRDEVVKLLTRPNAARGFELLSQSGLMREILPEVESMKGVEQSPDFHPEGDVFVHTRLLLEKLRDPDPILALAALFHDVGKPPTYAVRDGKIRFYEHAPVGAKMTENIMRRLRFSNDQIGQVTECVANHMKFADVQKMRSGKLKVFISRPTFETELELHKIDCASCHGMLDNYYFLKKKIEEYSAEDLKPDPFISGHDLMDLGMRPGPAMKPLLAEAYELQLEKVLDTRQKALDWAKQKIQAS